MKINRIINLILILVVIICFSKVVVKYCQYYKDSNEYSELQTFRAMVNTDEANIEVNSINNKYKLMEEELLDLNNDYKMWITISNTNIDYPIVQGEDNDFYTTHNFNKEESISGALFIDNNNNIESDKNIVIYGHHMKNETMFHNINYFKDKEFFNENEISIIKNGNEFKYKPFSVYVIPKEEVVFKMSFSDDNEYKSYVEELASKSYFNTNLSLAKDSKIITLVTCSYEYDGARTVVHCIK